MHLPVPVAAPAVPRREDPHRPHAASRREVRLVVEAVVCVPHPGVPAVRLAAARVARRGEADIDDIHFTIRQITIYHIFKKTLRT